MKRRPVERFFSILSPSLSFGSAISGGSNLGHPEVLPRCEKKAAWGRGRTQFMYLEAAKEIQSPNLDLQWVSGLPQPGT